MLGQQVSGEVAAQVAPHGVDVIGPVLGVVVLDEQARTAERVIVAGTSLDRPAHPKHTWSSPASVMSVQAWLQQGGRAGVDPYRDPVVAPICRLA